MRKLSFFAAAMLVMGATVAQATTPAVILNEWNCVTATNSLSGSDIVFGTNTGNGGNWVEILITANNTSILGYTLEWENSDSTNHFGTVEFVDEDDTGVWDNLAAGTIITILEPDETLDQEGYETTNLSAGTNWIHVTTNDDDYVIHYPAGFKVDNDDWRMLIRDNSGTIVQNSVGESISGWGGSGINSSEVGKLEANSSNVSSSTDLSQYDDGDNSTFGQFNTAGAFTQTH